MPTVYDTYDEALAAALDSPDQLAVCGVRTDGVYKYFVAPAKASDAEMWAISLEIRSGTPLSDLQRSSINEWVSKGYLTAGSE